MVEVVIACPAEDHSIEFIDDLVYKTMLQVAFPDYKQMHFAVHEAVINSIEATQKCYGEGCKESIEIKIIAQKERMKIIIRDKAGGLPEGVENCIEHMDFDDMITSERGRGLLFIKHFVDAFTYNLDLNGDAVFTLIKEAKENATNQ